jgi:hypothetical protein
VDEAGKLAASYMATSGICLADISEVRLEARPLREVTRELISLAGVERMDHGEEAALDARHPALRREANR